MTNPFRIPAAIVVLACASATLAQPDAAERLPLGARPAPVGTLAPTPPSATGATVQTVLALGAVVGAILVIGGVVRAVARRSGGLRSALGAGGRAPSGVLESLGRYPVARGSTLLLLKLDRRVLLVSHCTGRGGGTMSTLAEITDPEDVASILLKTRDEEGDSMAKRFQSVLSREDAQIDQAMVQPIARSRPAQAAIAAPPIAAPGVSAVRTRLAGMRRGVEVRA